MFYVYALKRNGFNHVYLRSSKVFLERAYVSHLLLAGTHDLTADFGVGEHLTLISNDLYGVQMYACCPTLIFKPNGNCYVPLAVK
jgi:hypothetical protein